MSLISSTLTPISAILVSLIAVVPIILSRKKENLREFWTFAAAGIKFLLVLSLIPLLQNGVPVVHEIWQFLPGISFKLKVDGLGLLFAIVASSLWIITSIYSIGYMRSLKEHAQTRYYVCFALALSATLGVAFSANLFTLYIFYELLSLSTYPLVTHNGDEAAKSAGRKYLSYLLGTSIGLVLPAMIIIYVITGTLEFTPGGILTGYELPAKLLPALVLMFLFGFGKAGLMPLHSWLPGAMVAPTPVSSLLHAVAVVKVGVFSIVRIITGILGPEYLTRYDMPTLICAVAAFTVVTASLMALFQDNLKRRLAFSTVGQLAYIILGVGLCSKIAIVGGITHIAMHAFGKITLFFCAGAIYVATGQKYISKMKGIGRKMPYTMGAFLIASLSIIGMPPTGGIISKWYMVLGSLSAGMKWVMVIYLISSFLNACYFLPIVYNAFFATDKESQYSGGVEEAPKWCLVPLLITATITVLLFLVPELFLNLSRIMVLY